MTVRDFSADLGDTSNYPAVEVLAATIARIQEVLPSIIQRKSVESHHVIDPHNEYKRFYTGLLGEAAVSQFLGVDSLDLTVGSSNEYLKSDLSKIGLKNIGIKTSEYWNYPLVSKWPVDAEIINIKTSDSVVLLCGLATKNILSMYQDDNLVLSPYLRKRNVKSGFYGFKSLIPMEKFKARLKK